MKPLPKKAAFFMIYPRGGTHLDYFARFFDCVNYPR